jgi:redox-sensitive bicupin YhaK (pirin superfamily)
MNALRHYKKLITVDNSKIFRIRDLGFQWETNNPFLFCVHHLDDYPRGNASMGPDASLEGRRLGNDFITKDGWRMYHGLRIPGFPVHPHRGFETVTIVLNGLVDHSDSMGACGRYGHGDVQWMTAGAGMQHAEMFPLVHEDKKNPLELFQIWLNLPAEDKFVKPHYKMLWEEDIPKLKIKGAHGKSIEITIVAGSVNGMEAVPPAPDSWAAKAENEVAIWLISMEAHSKWELPPASEKASRSLYFYKGSKITISGEVISSYKAIDLQASQGVSLENGPDEGHLLLLQGRPIEEPVVQYGPFVMNTQAEIQQAMDDYRRTQFGGWPWSSPDQVHGHERGRFAKYSDGLEELREG